MDIEDFEREVSRIMTRDYGISWADACGDREPLQSAMAAGETPEEFVHWWAIKYDLTHKSELFGGW